MHKVTQLTVNHEATIVVEYSNKTRVVRQS